MPYALTGLNIQSIENNPFIKLLYNKEFTQFPVSKPVNIPNSLQSIQNPLGSFIIEVVILQYNFRHGCNYDYTEFGIVPIPNDQNSRCSLLIFPLTTNNDILFKTYIELGERIGINFQDLGYLDQPDYMY